MVREVGYGRNGREDERENERLKEVGEEGKNEERLWQVWGERGRNRESMKEKGLG